MHDDAGMMPIVFAFCHAVTRGLCHICREPQSMQVVFQKTRLLLVFTGRVCHICHIQP